MRSQYYVSRVLSDQLSAGGKFSELMPVILVGVLDFMLFSRHNRCVTHHVLTDTVDAKQVPRSTSENSTRQQGCR
jgi:hypothetical protein